MRTSHEAQARAFFSGRGVGAPEASEGDAWLRTADSAPPGRTPAEGQSPPVLRNQPCWTVYATGTPDGLRLKRGLWHDERFLALSKAARRMFLRMVQYAFDEQTFGIVGVRWDSEDEASPSSFAGLRQTPCCSSSILEVAFELQEKGWIVEINYLEWAVCGYCELRPVA